MMSRDSIKIGDIVRFSFSSHPPIIGELKYLPGGSGDCWVVIDMYSGQPKHIQQFDFVEMYD